MNEYSYKKHLMGTEVSLSFVCDTRIQADYLAQTTFNTIYQYELRFSRFLPDSELSILNQNGLAKVSKEFMEVLKRSLELSILTEGAFNPLVQVARLGYQTSYEKLLKTGNVFSNEKYDIDLNKITITDNTNMVTLSLGQKLDFGGILKGYLASQLAASIFETNRYCTGCIINLGGDLATRGLDSLHKPFIFYLYNPITDSEIPIALKDVSLSTSGTYARRWLTSEGTKHHIIDSSSQKNPTQDISSVSIVAKDGALSEVLTKLFITRGIKEAINIVSPEKYQYQYYVVTNQGKTKNNLL